VRGVLFDIGGVLEITPPTGWQQVWCTALGIDQREMERRAGSIWIDGETGARSLAGIEQRTAAVFDLAAAQLRAYMDDVWDEYLGTLNVGRAQFFRGIAQPGCSARRGSLSHRDPQRMKKG
jgi:putative hydrolase of the HAD superfamily